MSGRLRILPLLIVVSMLSFSVRLVEFGMGVRHLSGSALAETKAEDPKKDPPKEAAKPEAGKADQADQKDEKSAGPGTAEKSDDSAKPEESAKTEEKPGAEDSADTSKWRDAMDSDEDSSGVKKEMFDDLVKRREALDKRERAIVTREALLQAAEQELDRKYQEMEALRSEIENLLEKQSDEEKARIDSLVKIYEGMKPKDAARIFDTLDLDVLVNVMSKMSERKLGPILASMNPERARSVTIMLAQEKSLPELPKN